MLLSNSQQRILADMGIQLWALRRSEPENPQQGAAETPVEIEQSDINVAAPVKLIVVTQAQAMSEAAQRLFNAMLKAARLTQDQVLSLAREINQKLVALHQFLFVEANPIPVKWALAEMGMIPKGIRLPMTVLSEKYHQSVREALITAGVLN